MRFVRKRSGVKNRLTNPRYAAIITDNLIKPKGSEGEGPVSELEESRRTVQADSEEAQ